MFPHRGLVLLQNKILNISSIKEIIQDFLTDSVMYFDKCYTNKKLPLFAKSFEFPKEYVVDAIDNFTLVAVSLHF